MKSIYNPNYNAGVVEYQIYYYYYYSRKHLYTHIECIILYHIIILLHLLTNESIFKLIYTVKQTRMSLFKYKI